MGTITLGLLINFLVLSILLILSIFDTFGRYWQEIAAVAGGLTIIFSLTGHLQRIVQNLMVVIRNVIKFARYPKRINLIETALTENGHKLDCLTNKLNEVMAEFKPNSGSSLRDSVNEIMKRQSRAEIIRRRTIDDDGRLIWETDETGAAVFISEALAEILGMSPTEALGWGWTSAIHDDDKERVTEEWMKAVKEKRSFQQYYRFETRGRAPVRVAGRAYPIRLGNDVVGFVGSLTIIKPVVITKKQTQELLGN